ncbi:MAG: class I SAM-dependent methyltransferase [Solirubrobacterales bacterium]
MRGSIDRRRLARLIGGRPQPPAEEAVEEAPVEPLATVEEETGEPVEEAAPPGPPPGAPGRFVRELRPGAHAVHATGVSSVLHGRLNAEDVAEVERLISQSEELQPIYAQTTDPGARRHMILSFGLWLGAPAVERKSGLSQALPPERVHVMARGPSAAAGGLYEADLVFDALASVGVDIANVDSALDFGCSSGRVVRVLAAAYPNVRWHGCDPNGPAIEWASENLPEIEFFTNGDEPPVPLADGSLDLAYAISIWSHFAPQLGLRWFEEMHRLIRPGGHLVCTTHGMSAIALYAQLALRSPSQSDEIIGALYRSGVWYAPEFGEEGDWGVVNPDWGTAFISPEWLLAQLCPRWRVLEFAPGRNQENQDVYVLQRV